MTRNAWGRGTGIDHQVIAVLSDQREDSGRILISFSAEYEVPNDYPLCQPPDHGSSCDYGFSTWTARLVQE